VCRAWGRVRFSTEFQFFLYVGQGGFLDFRSAVARQKSLDRADACLCCTCRTSFGQIEYLVATHGMLNGDERGT
jgi:hypothetical protein